MLHGNTDNYILLFTDVHNMLHLRFFVLFCAYFLKFVDDAVVFVYFYSSFLNIWHCARHLLMVRLLVEQVFLIRQKITVTELYLQAYVPLYSQKHRLEML